MSEIKQVDGFMYEIKDNGQIWAGGELIGFASPIRIELSEHGKGYQQALRDVAHALANDTDSSGTTSFSGLDGIEIVQRIAAEHDMTLED